MVNVALLSFLLYYISYGIDIFLIIYIAVLLVFLITSPKIIFPNIIIVLCVSYITFVVFLGILGARFDYIELDLLVTIGVTILLISNNRFVRWEALHIFLLCANFLFFFYWMMVLLTPYSGTFYNWLRGYDSLSVFFGMPRLYNVCIYYLIFLACSARLQLISLILVTPMLSVVPYTLIFFRMLYDNTGRALAVFLTIILIISQIDFSFLSDFYSAFIEQKSISIRNRMLLETPGLFGSLDEIRASESMLIYVTQKYGYVVSILLFLSIIYILRTIKISLFNSTLIMVLTNVNPVSLASLILFAKITQEINKNAHNSDNL